MSRGIISRTRDFATQFSYQNLFYEGQEHQRPSAMSENMMNKQKQKTKNQIKAVQQVYLPSENGGLFKKYWNYNFQKHTVCTVKKLLTLKYSGEASELEKLAHKMWTLFMVSNVKSKKILVVLFGKVNKRDQRDLELFQSCGFGQIWMESQNFIKRTQQFLRTNFCQIVTSERVWYNILNTRNIKARDEFYVYFIELLHMLREGPLMKYRINKKTARKIEENILSRNNE